MRKTLLFILLLTAYLNGIQAQVVDTLKVYDVLEEMPRFPACESLDTTIEFKNLCAQQQLLAFVNKNVNYPLEAMQMNAEGMVVVKFIVERDGSISNPQILKNVDGGCGNEVLRVINGMNEVGIKWIPGKLKGTPVRSNFTLPVKFKLEEAPPFVMVGEDSIWTRLDTPAEYVDGPEALSKQLNENLKYPEKWKDSCLIGSIDVKFKVDRIAKVEVLDMVDINNLGFDFWAAATKAISSTYGKWKAATYEGKPVPTSVDISLSFSPESAACKEKVDRYNKALAFAENGSVLFQNGDVDAGLAEMTKAVDMFPNTPEFLFIRGQAYLDNNNFEGACADLTKASEIAEVTWFKNILPIICKAKSSETGN